MHHMSTSLLWVAVLHYSGESCIELVLRSLSLQTQQGVTNREGAG